MIRKGLSLFTEQRIISREVVPERFPEDRGVVLSYLFANQAVTADWAKYATLKIQPKSVFLTTSSTAFSVYMAMLDALKKVYGFRADEMLFNDVVMMYGLQEVLDILQKGDTLYLTEVPSPKQTEIQQRIAAIRMGNA